MASYFPSGADLRKSTAAKMGGKKINKLKPQKRQLIQIQNKTSR